MHRPTYTYSHTQSLTDPHVRVNLLTDQHRRTRITTHEYSHPRRFPTRTLTIPVYTRTGTYILSHIYTHTYILT